MSIQLNNIEARILGCLVEKEFTTPDYYPLTMNALVNACNQKSNRAPVVSLEMGEVQDALDSLCFKRLAYRSAEGVRSAKFCHNLNGLLQLDPAEMALIAELLLRGPQTLGELRSRADRMTTFDNISAVEEGLELLMERDEPLVVRLPRQSGRKEPRFAQTFTDLPDPETGDSTTLGTMAPNSTERLNDLEAEVTLLRDQLDELRQRFETFQAEFE